MSDDTQVREFLARMAKEIDGTPVDPRRPAERARRHRSVSIGLVAILVAAIVSAGTIGLRSFTQTAPANEPTPTQGPVLPGSRPVFQRTATIGGLTVTSPSTWFLVDYWGNWNPDATSLDNHAEPMLELTNFDPGLSTPICDPGPGGSTHLPADGIAIFVLIGNDGRTAADLCGGNVETSSTGSAGLAPYTSVMSVGSRVTDADRATADEIWRSMSWNDPLSFYTRERSPRYVLDGWTIAGGQGTGILEARPSNGNVELSDEEEFGGGCGCDITVKGVPRPNALDGDVIGGVTQDAARVELRRAGVATPLVARLIDLPPSLNAEYDAYVFEPQPTGGPYEVVAIGSGGQVLGSNLPPLVHTERVGTVDAFGETWAVKLSTDADGYSPTSCVEPAATSTLQPCERGPGGGLLVQTSDGPHPAVFVTESVGNVVTAVDVLGG